MFTIYFRCIKCKAYFLIKTIQGFKGSWEYAICPHCGGDVDLATEKQIEELDNQGVIY